MTQPNQRVKVKSDPDLDPAYPRSILPLPSQLLSSNAAVLSGARHDGTGNSAGQTDTSQSLKQEPGNWAQPAVYQPPAFQNQYLQQHPDEAIGSFGEEDLIPDDANQFETDDHEPTADTENWLLDEALLRQPSGSSIIESDSILEYENGRTYNRAGYILPNDPAEQDRMDFQYAAFSKLLKGNLSFAPFVTSPRYVLDVCAGTGIWAIDFAEQNPSSHVIGVDLAAIQPIPPVPNVQFIKDDARKKWLYQCKFDYVHLRLVYLNFADPKALMSEAFENMNPGGWIEYQDSYGQILCKNGEVGPAVSKWCDAAFQGAMMLVGHDLQVAKHYKEWLTEVGFVDVREIKLEWPCNMWPHNRHLKEVGQWSLRNYLDGALGVTYKLLRSSGLSVREIDTLVASAKRELSDTRRHLYVDAWIVYARKPFEWELEGWFPEAR